MFGLREDVIIYLIIEELLSLYWDIDWIVIVLGYLIWSCKLFIILFCKFVCKYSIFVIDIN